MSGHHDHLKIWIGLFDFCQRLDSVHTGHPYIQKHEVGHHFADAEQEFSANKLGFWLFLATEILLFGGLFVAYVVFRNMYPDMFIEAHEHLNRTMGAVNTVVLICSSLTMALAVRAAQLGQRDRQVILLLQDAFRSVALAEKLGGRIALKSDGVPFFVFEMIRGLKEGQFITQLPDGTYVESKVINEIEVPSAVKDLIEARIRDISREEREVLDVGAVLGFDFDPDLVARQGQRHGAGQLDNPCL